MKKKYLIIIGVAIVLAGIALVIFNLNKETYTIEVTMVDDRSPDRILTVYNNKNEKVEVNRIETLNGVLLCNGYNTVVHFGDIEGREELKIVLKNNEIYTAKIVEKEVEK